MCCACQTPSEGHSPSVTPTDPVFDLFKMPASLLSFQRIGEAAPKTLNDNETSQFAYCLNGVPELIRVYFLVQIWYAFLEIKDERARSSLRKTFWEQKNKWQPGSLNTCAQADDKWQKRQLRQTQNTLSLSQLFRKLFVLFFYYYLIRFVQE